jgi:TRAP-type uncharacterized transport system fused permease subunit
MEEGALKGDAVPNDNDPGLLEKIAQYDPELRFRQLTGITLKLAFVMTLVLSLFHIYTAGFGVLQEWRHRAFHLSFVLPLVFIFYTGKHKTEGPKTLVYDIIYALIGASLVAVPLKELLGLAIGSTALLSIGSFLFILYFKRRELLKGRIWHTIDAGVFTLMILALAGGGYWILSGINYREAFISPNVELVFWSIFLFCIFLSLLGLFVLLWVQSLYKLFKEGTFRYDHDNIPYFDMFFAVVAAFMSIYLFIEFNAIGARAGSPSQADLLLGAFSFALILEGTRRSLGPPLPIICYLVLINAYLGPYFVDIPGLSLFAHRGYSIERIIEHMYLGTEGIYGIPLGVVATFVFHFVLFGIFISKTGLGAFFMDIAMAIAGWSAGGPAKVAVIASGFFGSISGSSVANAVTIGSFTIPLMKKVGYRAQFAGAVEAAASTGGQLMPPVMGAAAFIMAEFLGIPYVKIALCAVLPSFLHFYAVGCMVHFEAMKNGLHGLPRETLPKFKTIFKEKGLLIGPLIIIIWILLSGSSPFLAAFWGIIFSVSIGQIHKRTTAQLMTIILSTPCILLHMNPIYDSTLALGLWGALALFGFIWAYRKSDLNSWILGVATSGMMTVLLVLRTDPFLCGFWANLSVIFIGMFYKESKMRLQDILDTLEWGTKNALSIGVACACVGFIVGATTLTGLGLKFAAAVLGLAHGAAYGLMSVQNFVHFQMLTTSDYTLFFTLVFTMIACFILGMGIPTTAQYIIAVMIAAPALMQWHIHPLLSHMFVFFYAVLADVTPPVALAAFAAAGISGADPFKTGFTAFNLSMAKVFVPFAFIYSPLVLLLPRLLDPTATFDITGFVLLVITLFTGVTALGSTFIGYLVAKSTILERIGTGIAGLCLIIPGEMSDLVGILLFAGIYFIQKMRTKRLKAAANTASAGA